MKPELPGCVQKVKEVQEYSLGAELCSTVCCELVSISLFLFLAALKEQYFTCVTGQGSTEEARSCGEFRHAVITAGQRGAVNAEVFKTAEIMRKITLEESW